MIERPKGMCERFDYAGPSGIILSFSKSLLSMLSIELLNSSWDNVVCCMEKFMEWLGVSAKKFNL